MSKLKLKDENDQWLEAAANGYGVPSGGNTGDVLVKSSSTDYATGWSARDYCWKTVTFYKLNQALSYTATDIDWTAEINANCPNGYTFSHLELVGWWPRNSWANGSVTRLIATVETPNATPQPETTTTLYAASNQRRTP